MRASPTPDPLPSALVQVVQQWPQGAQEPAPDALELADALAAAPFGVIVLDRALRIARVNRWIAEASGVHAEAFLGRTLGEAFPQHDEPVAAAEARARSVLESGAACTFPLVVPERPGAARSEWSATCFPVLGRTGEVCGACLVVADVTAEREREANQARARGEAERQAQRLAYLQQVTAALSAARDPEAVARTVVEGARVLVGAVSATFRLVRGGALELLAASGEAEVETPRRSIALEARLPVTAAVARSEPVWLERREELDARFPRAVPAFDGTCAIAVLPLRRAHEILGTLAFVFDAPRSFDLEERAFLLGIAALSAQALERAMLHAGEHAAREAAQRATERLRRLQAITAALSSATTAEEVARHLADEACAVLGARAASVYVLECGRGTLRLAASAGRSAACCGGIVRIALADPVPPARVASTGESCWLESGAAVRAAFPRVRELVPHGEEIGAMAAVPLRARGAPVGALGFAFGEERTFEAEERELLSSVADQCSQALDRARLLDDERRAREDAERSREEADRARALLDGIVENAPLGIGFLDRELRFQRVNGTLARMNGLPPAAHVGRTPRQLLPGVPLDDAEAAWRRVLETGEPMVDVEVSGVTPAAPERRVTVQSWYPVRARGEAIGIGALVRDVTKAREAEAFERHVVGVVGHDLRNPLSAILVATRLLERIELPAAAARLVQRVAASAGRIDELVSTLLDFARLRGGAGVPLRRRRCDLAEIARQVADECTLAHAGRQVRCEGPACAGEWDEGRVGQLLSNLVSNALQHGPPDAEVVVRWREDAGGDAVVEVVNAGPPIAPELLSRLFEPFQSGGGRRGGLGLGLFIARALAVAHGGSLEVRSSEAEGTVFSARLPRG